MKVVDVQLICTAVYCLPFNIVCTEILVLINVVRVRRFSLPANWFGMTLTLPHPPCECAEWKWVWRGLRAQLMNISRVSGFQSSWSLSL